MEEKKESVNVSPDPSEQRAPLSPSADEAQAASAGSAPMDPAKCGAHEIHCIEQEAELAEARVRERVRTEAAEAERALDNAAHCASTEQKSVLSEEQPDKAQNTRLSSAKSPAPSDEQAVLEAQNSANWKMTLVILTTASVLMSLSYTMLIPFLPMYLLEELHVAQEDVNLWSGLVFSGAFLITGVMAPIWGALADKRSKKMMAVRAAALLAISYGLGGIVQNEWQLLAMRAFQGFAAGLWPACLAILSSSVPKTKLGFALGTMQGGLTAGGVIGPLVGGILAEAFGMRATFFLGAAALLTITVLIIFKIKEPQKRRQPQSGTNSPRQKTNLLRIPVVQRMLITAGVVQMTILFQQPIMPLYVAELQGSMDRIVLVTGILFSAVGLSGVFASPVWGIAGQKWGYRPVLYSALLGTTIFGVIQAIPNDLWQFGFWRFIGGLAFAGIFPAINAVLTNSTEPEDRGRIFGLSYAAQQIGSVIGPIAGGALGMWLGLKFVIFFSGILLLPMLIWLYLKRPKVEASTAGNAKSL